MSGQIFGPLGVLPVAGGGPAMSWTPTDARFDSAAGFVGTKTFLACSIGTPTATRQVLVAGNVTAAAGHPQTFTCTVGGVTATLVTTANSDGGSAGTDSFLFQAACGVVIGTTADIVINDTDGFSNNNIYEISIGVGALDGVNPTPAGVATPGVYPAASGFPYFTGSSVTVPTGGIVIGASGNANATATPGWSNITFDAAASATAATSAVTMGHITTVGAITPGSVFGNFAHVVVLAAAWGP